MSIGFEIINGEVFLILEMDHNPTQDEFTFGFYKAYPEVKKFNVIKENKSFGFNNKPVALLPMIEIHNSETGAVKFISDSEVYRTHQRINISDLVKEQSDLGILRDPEGKLYRYDDILEIQVLALKAFNESRPSIREYKSLKIPFRETKEGQIHQIYGTEPLTDLSEIGRYNVGDKIQIGVEFKIPYHSKDTQWVIRPEQSDAELLTYELILNPKVGDRFTVPSNGLNLEQVLPQLKSGYFWFPLEVTESATNYVMAPENAKLSPNIIYKYIQSMLKNVGSAHQNGQDINQALKDFLKNSPLKIRPDRLEFVTEEISKMNQIEPILQLLMTEQYNFPVLQTPNLDSENQCRLYLKSSP